MREFRDKDVRAEQATVSEILTGQTLYTRGHVWVRITGLPRLRLLHQLSPSTASEDKPGAKNCTVSPFRSFCCKQLPQCLRNGRSCNAFFISTLEGRDVGRPKVDLLRAGEDGAVPAGDTSVPGESPLRLSFNERCAP